MNHEAFLNSSLLITDDIAMKHEAFLFQDHSPRSIIMLGQACLALMHLNWLEKRGHRRQLFVQIKGIVHANFAKISFNVYST
jgi:hypothetical protein